MHHVISGVRHGLNGSPRVLCLSPVFIRTVATASNKRWQQRQFRDSFRRAAEVQGLKSRAAFKLLEIDAKHRIFAPGQTVFDLGFAPGSWSQVAVERTKPNGRVVGLDILPCQPPKGASSIQGNFLDRAVREDAIASVRDWEYGRPRVRNFFRDKAEEEEEEEEDEVGDDDANEDEASQKDVKTQSGSKKAGATEGSSTPNDQSYIDMERQSDKEKSPEVPASINGEGTVDVVLSDMLMDTSGIPFRDHAGSMDLCNAALDFAIQTVKPKGHFICKFYQGAEDKALEKRLKQYFTKVHREKPESSRKESKESYLVALKRKKLREPKT